MTKKGNGTRAIRVKSGSQSFALASSIAVLLAGISTTPTRAEDRFWDPLNNNTYLSTGYTTYTAATVVWNTTNAAFDASLANSTNTAWAAGDDAFINLAPGGVPLAAPATNWFARIGTTAPTVHNVTYDSITSGSSLSLLANNNTNSTAANMALTGGSNGASTWTVGADDILRLSSGGSVAGSTNVGPVNLVNATGVTTVDLVKEGTGRLHIQSTGSTFTGAVRINSGSLQINGNGSLGNAANAVYIADGAMLTANNNSSVSINRVIYLGGATGGGAGLLDAQGSFVFTVDALLASNGPGGGGLTKTNSGTVTLNNLSNSYTGVTTISGGTLRVSNLADGGVVSAIGASSSDAGNLVLNSGTTLNFIAASAAATNRLFTIGGSTNISNNSTIGTSTLAWTNPGAVANTTIGAHSLTLGGVNQGTNIFAPALSDNGGNVLSLIKGGSGNWTLIGNHSYTGATTVGNGTPGGGLEFNGTLSGPGGLVNVTTGNRLSGTGVLLRSASVAGTLAPGSMTSPLGPLTLGGSLSFEQGAGLAVNLSGTAASKVSGVTDLTLSNNPVSVTLNAANLPSGAGYDIVEYTGLLTGAFDPVVAVNGLTGLTSRIAFGLDYATANKVRLTQTGQAKSLIWTGSNGISPTVWNVNDVANWNSTGVEKFFDLDTVTFLDTAVTRTVDVTTNVTPSAIMVNNSAAEYVIGGSTGAIIGPASFTKIGIGKITISGAHSFTGPFVMGGGIVSAAAVNDATQAGPLGQGTLTFGGGTLEYTGTTATTSRPVTFSASGGTVNIPSNVELAFTAGITGSGGIVKTNGGTLVLSGNNGFNGPVVVSAGVLKLGNNNSLGSPASGTTVSAGATLDFAATTTAMALPQDEVITVSGAGADLNGDAIPDGALVNNGTAAIQNAVKKVVLAGDTSFGGAQRFDVRIAGQAGAGFVPGVDAFFKGNGFNFTKVGAAQFGIAGVGETNLANITISGGMIIFHDALNSDAAMMLASDTTLGRVDDGAGNFYKLTIEPGATLQFFNSDGVRSKDIVANGIGTDATITMNSNIGVAHTLTLNRGIVASGGLTLNSADAAETTLVVSGVISNGTSTGALTKIGGGVAVLTAANTYTGGTTVTAGTLQIGSDVVLGSGPLTLNGGGLSSDSSAPRNIANPTTLTANSTLGNATNTGAITLASLLNLGGSFTLTAASGVTLANGFDDGPSDFLFTKAGAGVLTLPVASSSSGGATVSAGRARLGHDSALGIGVLNLGAGAISSIGNAPRQFVNPINVTGNGSLGDLIDNGPLTFTSQVNLGNVARNLTVHSDVLFAAGITSMAPGGLNQKLGTGTLTIGGGASVSSGPIEIRGGTLVLASGVALASGDAVRVMASTAGGNATFSMLSGSSIVISLGTANLRIGHESVTITDGTNVANIAGNLAFAAGVTNGNVQLGSDSAFAQVNLLAGGTITVRSIGLGPQTPAGAVTEFNFDGGTLRPFVDNPGFFPAALTAAKIKAGGGTIDTNGFSIGITQPLVHDPGLGILLDGGLTKAGSGALTLSSANTYSGPTLVDAGSLIVSAPGSLTASLTTVNPAGSLSGNGTLRSVKLNGGTLSPGIGIGSLTVEDDVEFAGGIAAFDILGINPGFEYDQLVLSGFASSVVTISAPTELSLALGFTPALGDSFVLVENVSANPMVTSSLFTVGGMPVPDGGAFTAGGAAFTLHYDGGDGNDLAIVAVPEPASAAFLLGGLGILSTLPRRRE